MTTVTAQQTAADLLSAANHIEQFGLAKGEYGAAGAPCCARGAIQVAVYGRTVDEEGWDFISLSHPSRDDAATIEMVSCLGTSVAEWNDRPERTKEEVVAKFREAAEAVFPNA